MMFWHVRPAKTQISGRICAVWSEPSLSAGGYFSSLDIQNAPIEDDDQTAHSSSLIIIFTRCMSEDTFSDVTVHWPARELRRSLYIALDFNIC